ncbi:hypothetical protein ACH5RR_027173 [Cinchona calisaya]|uniref:C2HC zinc finger plants domain-containing protein n=1 Tax=Cinchona calisaya TaxID=153742 RepID=A0ABD2Z4N9_9GENT
MEAESTAAPPPNPTDQNDVVRSLLSMARQLIHQGNPSQALHAVVIAMRTKGGEEAVLQALNRARELYRNKIQESVAADELATLFAECAIAEATPSNSESSQHNMVDQSVDLNVHGTSILAQTGRKQIVLDAFSDGSSFVCLQCGGLVSNQRKEEHYTFWCCKI